MTSMPSQTALPPELMTFKRLLVYSKPIFQYTSSAILLLLIHFTVSLKLPRILVDVGIPEIETHRIQIFLLLTAIGCPMVFILIQRNFPDWIAPKRKLIILCLTTLIISIQLLLGAVLLKKAVKGFEVNLRLSISLKSLCFVIVSSLSIVPFLIHGMYSDAISPHCSDRINPYALSNMGCSLVRFFTLLPMIIVCALFSKPDDYIPCFTAILPLLSVNLMAYALEQSPKIHLIPENERVDEMESQF